MNDYLCTEERFLKDTEFHSMEIVKDDGVHRHITFTNGGRQVYRFDLITWPGHLCITGDMGTYVFRRLQDMFGFFRMEDNDYNKKPGDRLSINAGYWGEKLQATATQGGYKEFDEDGFRDRVREFFDEYVEFEVNDEDEGDNLWREIENVVFSALGDSAQAAYDAVHDFEYKGFHFQDFFDGGGAEQYTFHYIWCLYAIVYGITEYDLAKTSSIPDAPEVTLPDFSEFDKDG